MKGIKFNRIECDIFESNYLVGFEGITKETMLFVLNQERWGDAKNNIEMIINNFDDFEQCVEFKSVKEYSNGVFNEVLSIAGNINIHFVNKWNMASYFSIKIYSSYRSGFKTNELILANNYYECIDFSVQNIKVDNLINYLPLDVNNLYYCKISEYNLMGSNVCYILPDVSFSIPIRNLIINKIENIKIESRVEELECIIDYKNGLINFYYVDDRNKYHRQYCRTQYSGTLSLQNLEITLKAGDSNWYSST